METVCCNDLQACFFVFVFLACMAICSEVVRSKFWEISVFVFSESSPLDLHGKVFHRVGCRPYLTKVDKNNLAAGWYLLNCEYLVKL